MSRSRVLPRALRADHAGGAVPRHPQLAAARLLAVAEPPPDLGRVDPQPGLTGRRPSGSGVVASTLPLAAYRSGRMTARRCGGAGSARGAARLPPGSPSPASSTGPHRSSCQLHGDHRSGQTGPRSTTAITHASTADGPARSPGCGRSGRRRRRRPGRPGTRGEQVVHGRDSASPPPATQVRDRPPSWTPSRSDQHEAPRRRRRGDLPGPRVRGWFVRARCMRMLRFLPPDAPRSGPGGQPPPVRRCPGPGSSRSGGGPRRLRR